MNIDGICVAKDVAFPDFFEDGGARNGALVVFDEEAEEFELFVAQWEFLVLIIDFVGFVVDEEIGDDENGVLHLEKLFL